MTLSNYQINSQEAARLVGISVPTLFRFAGTKVGKDGTLFPKPEKVSARNFAWDAIALNKWVEINGKFIPSKRGRPRGSFKKPREETPTARFETPYYDGSLVASAEE